MATYRLGVRRRHCHTSSTQFKSCFDKFTLLFTLCKLLSVIHCRFLIVSKSLLSLNEVRVMLLFYVTPSKSYFNTMINNRNITFYINH
ncbi:hypothetical protein DICVIV_10314 [Dictyocaulus viviparus]|uniref:Uncharacterized protein n=1 Tax=Dictyocaulus viviparus TaxID=29172 RepID=A0A0D8XG86_DICVI|nr:hypothetical protein DICVIV_10314 [Dictyocaulus viviparus]